MKNILKEIRKKNDLTQIEFAKKLGVSRGVIAQIEIGKNKISSELAKTINDVFNYSIDYILNYNGQDIDMIDTSKDSYVGDFFKEVRFFDEKVDKLNMLNLVIKEFSKEKDLKGITPVFDRFNSQNNIFELIKEYNFKWDNNLLDDEFEIKCIEKINHASECLFDDLYNNMVFAYNIMDKYFK